MADDCLFCKIIAGEIPSNKVYSDDELFAFHDISPCAPVHVLLVPKKHIVDLLSTSQEDALLLGRLLLKASEIAEMMGLAESGFRCVVNTGPDSCRTIHHLHLHIIGGRQLELAMA